MIMIYSLSPFSLQVSELVNPPAKDVRKYMILPQKHKATFVHYHLLSTSKSVCFLCELKSIDLPDLT